MPTEQSPNDPAPLPDPPTEAEVALALDWALNTQPRRRRDGDEAAEVGLLARVPSVASELADRASDAEVLKLTAIRILEARLGRLPTADQAVARILLEFHTPIADRNEQIAALAGSSKTLPLRDQTIYRMAAVLLGRDPATVENLEVPEPPGLAGRRFRIGLAVGVAGLAVGIVAVLLAIYTDFLRDQNNDEAVVPLRFELSVDECDVARNCNSEANAVTAQAAGFTPGGFADVAILAPSGVDANELSAETSGYGYRTRLEVNDEGSFLWQYWWDPPMALGTYEIAITDRETDRRVTGSMTFLNSQPGDSIDDAASEEEATTLSAIVLGEAALNVRARPTTESEIVGTVDVGSRIALACYARGEVVTLDSNDPGNDLWHLITIPGSDPIQGYATDVFLNTPTGAEPLDDEPLCPAPGDIPLGDLYLPLRPDSRLGEQLQPGETLVVDLEVGRSGWIALDLDCAGEINSYPQLDGSVTITAHSGEAYWTPPNPVIDCNTDLVQGPVAVGTNYYYSIQLSPEEATGSLVGVVARFVDPPVAATWDDRVVLPQVERRQTDSISNTLSPGTIHAYTYSLTTRTRLLFAFDCNEEGPPPETPLRLRGIDLDGTEYFTHDVDDCVPWRAPAPQADGRYEIQIMAVDPAASVFYRLGAIFQN